MPGIYFALVTNSSPWSYLGSRPVEPTPAASFAAGLDLFAPRSMGVVATARFVRQALFAPTAASTRRLLRVHDLTDFTLRADRPMAFQVDGDYLGERESVRFRSMPGVLRVVV